MILTSNKKLQKNNFQRPTVIMIKQFLIEDHEKLLFIVNYFKNS